MRKFSFLLLTVFFFAIANAMESGTKTICSNFSGLATNLKVLNIKSEVTPLLNYYISIDAKTITYTSNTTKKDITEFGVNCNCKTDDFKIEKYHLLLGSIHAPQFNLFHIATFMCGNKNKIISNH